MLNLEFLEPILNFEIPTFIEMAFEVEEQIETELITKELDREEITLKFTKFTKN